MRGEFVAVWVEMWQEVWLPLIDQPLRNGEDGIPDDFFCELYREIASALKHPPSIAVLADIIDSPYESRRAFESTIPNDLKGERAVVAFLEAAHGAIEDLGADELSSRYFNLLSAFIKKYSLRYDLRRPCHLCPTLPGVFANLVRDLRAIAVRDTYLASLMRDFENAVRDLSHDNTDHRIKTCIQKQVNLLEGLGHATPGVTGTTLGRICDELGTWPHEKIKEAMKDLYKFASDYPGIRHGGSPSSALRVVDMRDMVAMSILLIGFTPYIESRLSADSIFGGSDSNVKPIHKPAVLSDGEKLSSDYASKSAGFLGRLAFWR